MNLETFFEKFDLFADAPDAVSKMRKLVLQLAVQGRLVEQDPNDEPAEEFLARTKSHNMKPDNSSKAGKTNETIQIAEDEIRFAIPYSWVWSRLETIADKVTDGEHLSPVKTASGMPLLTATHVTVKGVTLNNPQYVSVEDGYRSRQRCDPRQGDILICSRGTIGRCAVVEIDEIFCLMGSVILVRFPSESSPRYFNYFLSTDLAQTEMRGLSGATAVQALYLKDIRQALVPIPPLAEQKRIVAKVDELMSLCDRLEGQQQERETRHAALARASLTRFADAPTPANLNFIFHKSYDIPPADLRKSILTLAVQGHLSEGANVNEWRSVAMRDVCLQITDGEHATPERISNGVPLATAKNVRNGFLDLTNTDYVAQSTAEKCWKRCKPRDQDLLMVCVGATTGRVCLALNPPDIVLVRSVALIRPNTERIAPSFLDLFLRSPAGQSQIWGNVKQSAQPCLYLGKMADFEISLPPLVEQSRIVAKVDELMALVDTLESQLATARTTAQKLMEAVVKELTAKERLLPKAPQASQQVEAPSKTRAFAPGELLQP